MSDKRTEERNELFDSAMREKLSGYEPTVPHALWNRISAELNETESNVMPSISHYKEVSVTPRWKIAIAAAIVITLGAGSLLYTINTKNEISSTSTPVAKAAPVTTAPAVSIPVSETKTVAQSIPAVTKKPAITAPTQEQTTIAPAITAANTAVDNNQTTAQATEEKELAAMPPASQNNPVEVGNIPLYSLNKLSSPVSLNDEITVIKSTSVKKKHHRHNSDDESTKVILLGKKFETKPDIRYQVPLRF